MTPPTLDDLQQLRPSLLRFATLQLRNAQWAEDVVQDTLLAALEKLTSFQGGSSFRTWVTGILKHKLIDALRQSNRTVALQDHCDDNHEAMLDELFEASGHFVDRPQPWPTPDESLNRKDFFRVLQACVDRLPASTGQVFMMREWLELDTDEICARLHISQNHCWVQLYRARMKLRECLQLHWFGQADRSPS